MTITCGSTQGLTQQHGLFHGGVVASVVDVASGYAALSEAVLFSFWDRPVQEALQLFREERRDA